MRKYNRKKDREREKRDSDRFERSALAEPHPQECAVCLDRVKTHLLSNCGNQCVPYHRHHGLCEECAGNAVADGRCPLCMMGVHEAWPVGTAFFAGI